MSAAAPQVIYTRRFERALEALLDHYDAIRHLHPDAGSRALDLLAVVELKLPVLLAAQPRIGRRAVLGVSQSQAEIAWLSRLAPLTSRRRLEAREWLIEGFWILYHRTPAAIYVASARGEREATYR
ncbi:hypothetical protein [Rhizobacter sp. P5_C2]